ncbi:MAG TPA: Wzz/FepE/Etk N-terminal domain-containing protein, partial [bacterium]
MTERSTSLRHFLSVVFRRMWVILSVTALALLVGGFQLWRMPPQYEAQSKLLLERDPELEKALLLRISSGSRSEEASFSYTQESEIMTSRPVLERVIRQLGLYGFDDTTRFADAGALEAALQIALKDMNSNLSIVPSPDPNIIKVKYKSVNPQLCAAIVDTLVRRYIEYRFEIFSDDQTIAFLDQQIEAAAGNLNELQQKRATFQSEGTLYSPDREGNLLFSRLGDYENRADAIKLERVSKESKLRALRDIVASGSFMELPAIDLGAN